MKPLLCAWLDPEGPADIYIYIIYMLYAHTHDTDTKGENMK